MRITRKNHPDLRKLRYPFRFVVMLWFMYAMVVVSLLTTHDITVSAYDKILHAASGAVLPLGGTFVLVCRLLEKDVDPARYFDRCAKLYAATFLVMAPLSYVIGNAAASDLYMGSQATSGALCAMLLRTIMTMYGP